MQRIVDTIPGADHFRNIREVTVPERRTSDVVGVESAQVEGEAETQHRGEVAMGDIMMGLGTAMNNHDLDAFVALFADDYRSEQPAHPTRSFQGADKVRENWASVFAGIPNLRAELLTSATTRDGVEVGEWDWHGNHVDGSEFAMRGVIVVGIEDGRIAWGRLYMEPIEREGTDIDTMVRQTYRPPDEP